MLKRRGARTDPWGTPFLRRRNLLGLLSPVVRVKLLLRISSIIIRTMCLLGTKFYQKSKQLAGEATVPDSVIGSCQVDKHGTSLLFRFECILNVLRERSDLIHGGPSTSKARLFPREQRVHETSVARGQT